VFDCSISKAFSVNFNEIGEKEIKASKNELPVSLGNWKVQTYKLVF